MSTGSHRSGPSALVGLVVVIVFATPSFRNPGLPVWGQEVSLVMRAMAI